MLAAAAVRFAAVAIWLAAAIVLLGATIVLPEAFVVLSEAAIVLFWPAIIRPSDAHFAIFYKKQTIICSTFPAPSVSLHAQRDINAL